MSGAAPHPSRVVRSDQCGSCPPTDRMMQRWKNGSLFYVCSCVGDRDVFRAQYDMFVRGVADEDAEWVVSLIKAANAALL